MGILDTLIEKNEAPILFIGSGISRRYLKDFLSWEQLLIQLWSRLGYTEDDYYKKLLSINQDIGQDIDSSGAKFQANKKIASIIEKEFDAAFTAGRITISEFTAKQAYVTGISPFKKEVANCFTNFSFKEEMDAEIRKFKSLLLKARAIITTNYDRMIESLCGPEIKVFTRQSDLFLSQTSYGELYKVHGCVSSPNEIILTEKDYDYFNDNSVLISAKLTSFLMESPIIFLGYSLTDQNISNILKKFTQSLHADQRLVLKDRIIYVSHKKNEHSIREYLQESNSIGAQFTVIETDNYAYIYDCLSKIEQGVPVSYIRQFQNHIRELIIERGKKGTLKALLLSPNDLDAADIRDDDLVIAIGNNTVIFNLPNRLDYLKDYIKENGSIATTVALKFIASQTISTRIPIYKHLNNVNFEECGLRPDEIEKIHQRRERQEKIELCIESINQSYRKEYFSLEDILALRERRYKEIDLISWNFQRLNREEVFEYLVATLDQMSYGEWKECMTQLSRLMVIWDYYCNRN